MGNCAIIHILMKLVHFLVIKNNSQLLRAIVGRANSQRVGNAKTLIRAAFTVWELRRAVRELSAGPHIAEV